MSNNTFAKFALSILLSLVAFSSAANDIKDSSDSLICTHLTELVLTDEAFINEAKERQLNCSKKYDFTTSKNNPPEIPLNSHVEGDGWKCNVDFYVNNSKCLRPPQNSYIVDNIFICNEGFEKNKDSTACIPVTTDTPKKSEKPEESAAENESTSSSSISIGIALLALVLLIILVSRNPRFQFKNKKNTEPGQKPKNKPNPDQPDDKQTIVALRKDLSALMSSMNDLNQTFMTLKSSLDQKDKEIARYKNGYDATIYKNFLLRFARVDKVIKEYISENKIDMNGLEDIQIQMDDALAECEVEVFSPELGADYKTTAGLADKPKIIETSDNEKNGQIAEIIAPGYQRRMPNDDYEVIIEAKVAIHVFKK